MSAATSTGLKALLAQADDHFNNNRIHENYDILYKLCHDEKKQQQQQQHAKPYTCTDPDVMWRFARANYDLACETTKKDESEKYADTGLLLVEDAKVKIPDNFNVYKWHGILLGKKNSFLSPKQKIANAFIIKDNFMKSASLNPSDSTTQYCLGSWCWNILQISWLERKAAAVLFGSPPTSSYEECEAYLNKAWSLNQEGIHTATLMGDVQLQQKRCPEAKMWYALAKECPAVTEHQKRESAEAATKLEKCPC